jgi:lipoate synthase
MKTITEPSLSSVLNGFNAIGCNLEQFPRIPEIIFARTSYKNRFEMLKQAKERHANPSQLRQRRRRIEA